MALAIEDHPASLSPAQERAVALLASGLPIAATAKEVGVSRATLHNWLHNPRFTAAYRTSARSFIDGIRDDVASLSRLALDNIRHILTDPKIHPSVKLRASLAVLTNRIAGAAAFDERQQTDETDPQSEDETEETEPMLEEDCPTVPQPIVRPPTPGRNSQCPCGSGIKYKRCCANKRET